MSNRSGRQIGAAIAAAMGTLAAADLPQASPPPDERSPEARLADTVRFRLALRGWVNPRRLIDDDTPDPLRVLALNALASEIETSFAQRPGQWFLGPGARRRVLAGASKEDILKELATQRWEGDAHDPVRGALRGLFGPGGQDLGRLSVEELQALHAVAGVIGSRIGGADGIRDRVAARISGTARAAEIERLLSAGFVGREDAVTRLTAFLTEPYRPTRSIAALQIHGVGGSGKSTVLAEAERRVSDTPGAPVLAHLDFDRPDLDPADHVSLDLALLEQIAIAAPQAAPACRALAERLVSSRQGLREDLKAASGRPGSSRRPDVRRSFVAQRESGRSEALESVVSSDAPARNSLVYNALAPETASAPILPAGRPLALVLDTLEVVSVRGHAVILDLIGWLESLVETAGVPDLRVVLASRDAPGMAGVRDVGEMLRNDGHRVGDPIALGDLPEDDALRLLMDAGVRDKELARVAARALPGNPLVLRIAATLFTEAPGELEEIRKAHAQGRIDRATAARYLTQRVIAHLPNPVARPYALAAILLPEVNLRLVRDVVVPAADHAGKREATPPHDLPRPDLPRKVFDALLRTAWLVVPAPSKTSFTFHPELRALILRMLEAAPEHDALRAAVRDRAIAWHQRRRTSLDRALALYHRILRGDVQTLSAEQSALLPLLGRWIEDLPERIRDQSEPLTATIGAPEDVLSDNEWRIYLEGLDEEDGQGAKLVKRGDAWPALELYRSRPTRPFGVPPTFVLQALADTAEWWTGEAHADLVMEQLQEVSPPVGRLSGRLLSRLYWITRLRLLSEERLSPYHIDVLRWLCRGISPGVFPSLIAVAEAFHGVHTAPDSWIRGKGAVEAHTRLYLVRALRFGDAIYWRPNLEALTVAQADWWNRLRQDAAGLADLDHTKFSYAEDMLRRLNGAPYAEVGRALRELRTIRPALALRPKHPNFVAGAVLLLRGTTIEFHRPLRAALIEALYGHPSVRDSVRRKAHLPYRHEIRFLLEDLCSSMTIVPREFLPQHLWGMVESNPEDWIGALVSFADRARLLPELCVRCLGPDIDDSRPEFQRLKRVAKSFLAWDRAISGPEGSGWWSGHGSPQESKFR